MGHNANFQKFMQLQALYNTNVKKTGNFIRPRKRIKKKLPSSKPSLRPRITKQMKHKQKPKSLCNMLRNCSLESKNNKRMKETLKLLQSLRY